MHLFGSKATETDALCESITVSRPDEKALELENTGQRPPFAFSDFYNRWR
jgi:hypothetical protein